MQNPTENAEIPQNINIIVYCLKCGGKFKSGTRVKDHNKNEFCDRYCRSEYAAENRRESESRYREFRGLD